MFNKKIKKLIGVMGIAAFIGGTFGNTMSTYAANVTDTWYEVNVKSSSGTFAQVDPRDKHNNSKVYVNISESPYKYVHVRVYGNRNGLFYHNETVGTTATVQRGVASSITNNCYEHKEEGASTVLTKVGFRSGSSVTGTVKGVWSPDSTKNYTIVN